MKEYIDLRIEGTEEYLQTVLREMKDVKDTEFQYNEELSNGMALNFSSAIENVGCFVAESGQLFHSRVYVDINHDRDDDKYYIWIPNIISSDKDHLEKEEYNSVLKTFVQDIVERVVPAGRVELTDENQYLSDKISPKSYEALELWESTSDHNSPFSHPLDRRKWMDFVSSVFYHKDDEKMSVGDLEGWLKEDKGWSTYLYNVIDEIEEKYEDGIELLHYYDGRYNRK